MLSFFRKYQKIFFVFVTIIVVTSFVFFGTYQAFGPGFRSKEEESSFETLDKKSVTCGYFQDMTHFLGVAPLTLKTGHNFLSDAFLTKDILETGLYGPIVAKSFNEKMRDELTQKLAKEKHFKSYANPYIPMLNVENVWALFAPDLKEKLNNLQAVTEVNSEAFKARVELFLAERRFPAELLSYILQHQARDYPDLPPDPRLQAEMLSLFNYRTLIDWFGPTFVEEVAKTVIQGAAWARQLGHKVTREEVVADLVFRREKAFQQNPALKERFGSSSAYYQECLKMLGMDEQRLFQVATDILLFRRLFDGAGSLPAVDLYGFQRFYQNANAYVDIELYHLPKEYCLQNAEDLKKLETYYQLVSSQREHPLDIPSSTDPLELIEKRAPELVVTSFDVEMSEIALKEIAAKVSVKETLEWETDPQHWKLLKEAFPQLENLEEITLKKREERSLIDSFAREQMVKMHPEWIEERLIAKSPKSKKLLFGAQEESLPGITQPLALKELLEKGEPLKGYSQDGVHFYSITLKTKTPEKTLLSYPKALAKGVLDGLVERLEESTYQKVAHLIQGEMNQRWGYLFEKFRANPEAGITLVQKKEEKIFPEGGVISFAEAKSVKEGELSPVSFSPELGAYYFKSLGQRVDTTVPLEKLQGAQKMASNEVKRLLMHQLLQKYE